MFDQSLSPFFNPMMQIKGKVVPLRNRIGYGGVKVGLHSSLTSALGGGEWESSRHFCFIPGETALGTHWTGDWVGPSIGREVLQKRKEFLSMPGTALRFWLSS